MIDLKNHTRHNHNNTQQKILNNQTANINLLGKIRNYVKSSSNRIQERVNNKKNFNRKLLDRNPF